MRKGGKPRNGEIKNCLACNQEFYVAAYRRNTAKFCSLYCQNHRQHEKFIFNCKSCGKEVVTSPCRRREKKKFCSVECAHANKQKEQERRKNHRALLTIVKRKGQARTLRKAIFLIREKKCERCGYCEFDFCLDVHHKDKNCFNNDPHNIQILCAICHRIIHKESKKK